MRNDLVFELNFDQVTTINHVMIRETGFSVQAFHLEAWDGEKWTAFYNNDLIGRERLCVFDPIDTNQLRLVIDDAKGTPSITGFEAGNQAPFEREKPFHVVGYFSPATFSRVPFTYDREQLAKFTDVILHNYLHWDIIDDKFDLRINPKINTYIAMMKEAIGDLPLRTYLSVRNQRHVHMSRDPQERAKIISTILQIALDNGFYGVDVDYEYPETPEDWDAYSAFLVELGQALHENGLKFSAATGVHNNHMSDAALDALDFYNIMVYDNNQDPNHFFHSTFEYQVDALESAKRQGMKLDKIILGMPFYGFYSIYKVDYSNSRQFKDLYNPAEDASFDYGANFQNGYYFNGPYMVKDKTAHAIFTGCRGVMVWHIVADAKYEARGSLTRAINEAQEQFIKK